MCVPVPFIVSIPTDSPPVAPVLGLFMPLIIPALLLLEVIQIVWKGPAPLLRVFSLVLIQTWFVRHILTFLFVLQTLLVVQMFEQNNIID